VVAERGTALLRQKLTLLAQQAEQLREQRDTTARQWRAVDAEARTWLTRAALLGGERAIGLVTGTDPLAIQLRWTTVMGLRYPTEPAVRLPELPADRPTPGSAALVRAEALYRDAAVAAVRHAAAAAALAAVEAETAATRQHVRSLERRWIPRLNDALAAAELQIAELENADAVRLRRAASPP
jgi:vacuolar-type H+-ATPase subunit D/Vma8